MPTYLYCLVDPDAELALDDLVGIDGGAVRLLRTPPVAALVSDVGEGGVAPTAERARIHDAVVRRAMAATTPLPARFGQLFA
ncbi:MAG: GvpL/GvpF family gas vesicle protein, partial [Gemmatimonadota bacterium]|nr:GvpL/GvpF family gas vesicle protein [Gemmatimonadota bacterium]